MSLAIEFTTNYHLPHNPYSAGIDFSRQILTPKVDPRTVRVEIFLIAVEPYHRYSNEQASANEDIYDDFKLKKPFGCDVFYKLFQCFKG